VDGGRRPVDRAVDVAGFSSRTEITGEERKTAS
jgi:hypothetical protein